MQYFHHCFLYGVTINRNSFIYCFLPQLCIYFRGRHGRDRIVVGFTTAYAIIVYHHWCCEFESRSGRGVQHYVIKFVSDLRQVGDFPLVLHTGFLHQQNCQDITEILLKVTLNTINHHESILISLHHAVPMAFMTSQLICKYTKCKHIL